MAKREGTRPFMLDLYEATHENVHLAILDGHKVLYLEKVSGRRSIPIRTRARGRLPLHATGLGKVLLAFAPDELFSDVVADGLRRYTVHTIVAPGPAPSGAGGGTAHLRRVRQGGAHPRDLLRGGAGVRAWRRRGRGGVDRRALAPRTPQAGPGGPHRDDLGIT